MISNQKPTAAREYALKFLYQMVSSKIEIPMEEIEDALTVFHKSYTEEDPDHLDNNLNENMLVFAKKLISHTIENYAEVMEIIKSHLKGWKLENVDKVDLTILLLGVTEMKYIKKTPVKVVINESVNMARKYGKNESFSFVNGIMDSIAKKIRVQK